MFLATVVNEKRQSLKQRQAKVSLSQLQAAVREQPPALSMGAALVGDGIRLIAEVKKASPSKGLLYPAFSPVRLAGIYARSGAAGISVLTEPRYFRGNLGHLAAVRRAVPATPLLRKDFILEPYQVYESRAWGADALLLIVAILEDSELRELLDLSHRLGMQCLVETHSEAEVARALAAGARLIGINNRDLETLKVDIDVTRRLCPLIDGDRVIISESGIKHRGDIARLRQWGVGAVLVGEALVTAPDIPAKIKELVDQG